mmetsp:Transcript_115141/g.181207  ORF Transcript_115141/g.181207 Transcript_115141/m.181207 type:complete len:146 (-) Transcript_115141:419-856(-)
MFSVSVVGSDCLCFRKQYALNSTGGIVFDGAACSPSSWTSVLVPRSALLSAACREANSAPPNQAALECAMDFELLISMASTAHALLAAAMVVLATETGIEIRMLARFELQKLNRNEAWDIKIDLRLLRHHLPDLGPDRNQQQEPQ